jgi:hypothetical protein
MIFLNLLTLSIILIFNTKSCSTDGTYQAGSITVKWISSTSTTNITMSRTLDTNSWFAFGLSTDKDMVNLKEINSYFIKLNFYFFVKEEDDVALCQVNSNGTVNLFHNYNIEGENDNLDSVLLLETNPTVGFSNIITSYINGVATCSFTRINYMSNVANYLNINNKYYILTANGPLDPNIIGNILIQKTSLNLDLKS